VSMEAALVTGSRVKDIKPTTSTGHT
jgi:hypothetical protein